VVTGETQVLLGELAVGGVEIGRQVGRRFAQVSGDVEIVVDLGVGGEQPYASLLLGEARLPGTGGMVAQDMAEQVNENGAELARRPFIDDSRVGVEAPVRFDPDRARAGARDDGQGEERRREVGELARRSEAGGRDLARIELCRAGCG
jgi:hypothetical protein